MHDFDDRPTFAAEYTITRGEGENTDFTRPQTPEHVAVSPTTASRALTS